ncbi:MAG: hypothetical protein MHM6MM_003542 [Cercozoa sp. M6MM]
MPKNHLRRWCAICGSNRVKPGTKACQRCVTSQRRPFGNPWCGGCGGRRAVAQAATFCQKCSDAIGLSPKTQSKAPTSPSVSSLDISARPDPVAVRKRMPPPPIPLPRTPTSPAAPIPSVSPRPMRSVQLPASRVPPPAPTRSVIPPPAPTRSSVPPVPARKKSAIPPVGGRSAIPPVPPRTVPVPPRSAVPPRAPSHVVPRVPPRAPARGPPPAPIRSAVPPRAPPRPNPFTNRGY